MTQQFDSDGSLICSVCGASMTAIHADAVAITWQCGACGHVDVQTEPAPKRADDDAS